MPSVNDRISLSNDTVSAAQQGTFPDEEIFTFFLGNETSAHGTAAVTLVPVAGPMKANGRIVDLILGVVSPAVSASGFISGNISADVRINSAPVTSTQPLIKGPVGSAGAAGRQNTNKTFTSAAGLPSPISAVINLASSFFSTGDQISIDYVGQSAGSAAAGTAGAGAYVSVLVRYSPK